MFSRIINSIKLASQTKQNTIKLAINRNEMHLIRLLIKLNFISYMYKPKLNLNKKYNNYYYIVINTNNPLKIKNLYRPSALRTISYKELSKRILSKKSMYVLTTNKGLITHNIALKYKISGIMLMVVYL